ncbi:hypothetical protein [Flavivirga jejuensis]|uniref:Uncharacterized protein n=1 Tax=Flavivirga jejuensis TaxID=870487 RepID=A0ABT8WM89_9FLAO|nr:hypothetical protein [Flavivirga jejuensis]
MGLIKGFVTIYFIASKHTKPQNTNKQGLYGVNEICSAALARYPLAIPFFPLVKIPSQLTKKSVTLLLKNYFFLMGTVI